MNGFGSQKKTSSPQVARQKLIQEELRFLLEGDKVRFSRQLLSRLLAEGCNLPLALARPRFYDLMIEGLTAALDVRDAKRFDYIDNLSGLKTEHAQFYRAMCFFEDHVQGAGPRMTQASLDALATIVSEWQLKSEIFQKDRNQFDLHLKALAQKMAKSSPSPTLSKLPLSLIRRRLYITLTTSLLRFVKNQTEFEARFGTLSEALVAMQADHTVFSRVMAIFLDDFPYGEFVASQTFWRTIQTLDNESQAPFPE